MTYASCAYRNRQEKRSSISSLYHETGDSTGETCFGLKRSRCMEKNNKAHGEITLIEFP